MRVFTISSNYIRVAFKKNLFKNKFYTFCEGNKSNQRYHYDYEAPETQELSLKSIGTRLLKRLLIIGSVLGCVYLLLLRKYNPLAKNYKLYIINDYFDTKFSEYSSKKLQKLLSHYIYRNDSDEANLVFKVYKQLLEENKINIKVDKQNIFVIDSLSIGGILFKNGDLYISNRILELAGGDENEIAFFIAIEIASNLQGKTTGRIFKYFYNEKLSSQFKEKSIHSKLSEKSLIKLKTSELHNYNKYLYFYPESQIATLLEESELIRIAIQLLKKADFNLTQAILIMKKFDDKLKHYPVHYQDNILVSKENRYFDICRKFVKVYLI